MEDKAKPCVASTVIVLGVDTPIGVAILRDLGRHGFYVIAIGRSKYSIGFSSRYCNTCIVRRPSERELIEQLVHIGREHPDAALLTISEHDNILVNRYRAELESELILLSPNQKLLESVIDKSISLELAREVGIRIPETYQPTSMQDIETISRQLTYPRVLKWSDPNKMLVELKANALDLVKYDYVLDSRELVEKLRPYETIGKYPLVQEYCPGVGLGQMFLIRSGEIIIEFQHERLHEWPPEGGVSTLCKSVQLDAHQECREKSIALLKKLQWNGVAMVEYRYDAETHEYYFMEVNGRFWGSLPLAVSAGVSFASDLVESAGFTATGQGSSAYQSIYSRYMIPEVRRLARILFTPKKIKDPFVKFNGMKELAEFIYNFFRSDMHYYLFCFDDPGPFFADMRNIALKPFSKRA